MNRRLILQLTSALVTTAAALTTPSLAAAADAPGAAASTGVEEIVVTTERFKSTVQSTPVAVTAFSPTVLEDRLVSNVQQIASQIPGIVITPATGTNNSARIVLRGAGQEQSGIQFDAAVGVYVDNVYQPRINGAFFDFFDIDRLEVLRGPQGTLYGRNTSGGAIKIITQRPSFTWGASGDVALGSYNTADARFLVTGPVVSDKLAFSLTGVTRNRDGWTADSYYGRKVNNKKTGGLRGKLLYTPDDKLTIEASLDYQYDHSDPGIGSPVRLFGATLAAAAIADPAAVPGRDLFTSELTGPIKAQADSYGGSINASYVLSPIFTLSSTTGYRDMRAIQAEPFTLLANLAPVGGSYKFNDHFVSQEFDLNIETGKLKGVVGAYYFNEYGIITDTPIYTAASGLDTRSRKTEAEAIFAQGTYQLGAGFAIVAGLRYTNEAAGLTQNYINQVFNGKPVGPQSGSKTFTAATPKIGLNWQATPNTLFYVSDTRGFKSGGFNNVNPSTNVGTPGIPAGPVAYGAETVTSYEAGVKFSTDDHRFRLNAAIFRAEYQGLQLPVFFPGTANTYTSNASNAVVQGIELEPTWQITSDLQIYGNASFDDGKYTSDFNCSLANTTIVNCRNAKLKGVVPESGTLGATYRVPLSIPGKIRVGGDAFSSAAYFNNVSNTTDLVKTPAYTLFNAFIAWDSPNQKYTVSVEAKNLTDKRFALETLQLGSAVTPSDTAYPNDPRLITVRVKAKF